MYNNTNEMEVLRLVQTWSCLDSSQGHKTKLDIVARTITLDELQTRPIDHTDSDELINKIGHQEE